MITRFSFMSLLFCLLALTNCRDIKEVQCTGVKGFKINKMDAKGIDGDILIGIKNPNAFGFSIYKSAFDVTYSGIYLGKAKLVKRVHIHNFKPRRRYEIIRRRSIQKHHRSERRSEGWKDFY